MGNVQGDVLMPEFLRYWHNLSAASRTSNHKGASTLRRQSLRGAAKGVLCVNAVDTRSQMP